MIKSNKNRKSNKSVIKVLILDLVIAFFSLSINAQNNYQLTAVSGTFTAISGGTNVPAIQAYAVLSSSINLGFTFTYNGVNYTQVEAASQGYLSFNASPTTVYSVDLVSSANRPLIAPLWGSGINGTGGTASYITTGSSPNRVFTFEWKNWQWGGSASMSFEVKLYETSNQIEFIYQQESGALSYPSAAIGLAFQNTGSGNFVSLSDAGTSPTISTTLENQQINTKPATGQIYRFNYSIDPEPTNHATSAITNSSNGNISLSWSDAMGAQLPDGYLILASTTNSFTNPTDGSNIVTDNDLSDGIGVVQVPQGVQNYASWINIQGLTTYYFKIYAFTNNGIYINYKTNGTIPVTQVLSPVFIKQTYLSKSRETDTQSASWCDFNKDGWLDIIVGNEIYTNNGDNTFTTHTIIKEHFGYTMEDNYQTWGDYNNDEDLDLLMTYGLNQTGLEIKYYTDTYKNGTGNVFTQSNNNLIGLANASTVWADLNNDGLSDFIISGNQQTQVKNEYIIATTKLYYSVIGVNGDTSYVDSGINLKGGQNVTISDYNNDNYQDILISGKDINSIRQTTMYKNNGDKTFTEQKNILLTGLSDPASAWGDYNNDGNLDILISGKDDNSKAVTKIYKNNGNNSFTEQTGISLTGLYKGDVAWGDYNNDGFSDILYGGMDDNSTYLYKIYKNNGNNTFTEDLNIATYIQKGSLAWGDFNNDGDLDFVSMGNIWKNSTIIKNTKPSIPQNLKQKRIDQNSVKLSWVASTDTETPSPGLSYNIRVGTQPGKSDVLSPLSDPTNGYRRVVGLGNANLSKEFILKNLTPGKTYYWSVQTIDNGFLASNFAPEQSFTVIKDFSLASSFRLNFPNTAAWGDYDNDNDLDLLVGDNIYQNDGADIFTKQYTLHSDVTIPLDWGDYNNDGYLDYIETSKIFKNNADGTFDEQTSISIRNLTNGKSVWGDFDNDGDLDFLITGKPDLASNPIAVLYKNNANNTFSEQTSIILKGALSAAWGDYDNDGNLDILIGSIIYKNNGNNTFTEQTDISFEGGGSSISWGDYDHDGDLDLLLTGVDALSNPITNIYRNDGNNKFILIDTGVRKVNGMAFWGDCNNDGFMDILLSGKSGSDISRVYLNKGNNTFTENFNFDGPQYQTKVGWGDYNNDGNLDIFESAMVHSRPQDEVNFYLYKNSLGTDNKVPGVVLNLQNELLGFTMKLSWDKAVDPDFTGNLYYNVRIGTTPGGLDILSPMSDPNTGFRKIPALGNAQCNRFLNLNNLAPGKTYYWSVQAIDQGFAGGAWASEKSFVMPYLSANFTADTACFGSANSFNDLSLSPNETITSWLWNFGDGGGTSTLQNPKYTYGAAGTYQVILTINSASYQHSITKSVVVKPSLKATFTAPNVCMGKPLIITNTSQLNGLTITSWNWSFGDKTADFNGQNPPPHNYLSDSAYIVELKVKVDNGCSDSISNEVIVGRIPSAIISTNGNTTFCAGSKFIMTAESFPNFKYEWRKDNVPLLDKITNVFDATVSGVYKVNITNLLGNCTVTSSDYAVTVNPVPAKPTLSFAQNPAVYCEGSMLSITTTNEPNTNYQWLKNNAAILGANTNLYQASQTGLYRLKVSNSFSCADTSSTIVDLTINPKPAISSALSITGATTFCAGNSVQLEAELNPDYIYKWKKDGNYIINDKNILKASQSGNYLAEVSTTKNCMLTTNLVAVVSNPLPDKPVLDYAANPAVYCEGGTLAISTTKVANTNYQWLKNNLPIASANTSSIVANETGLYRLKVSNVTGCADTSTTIVSLTINPKPAISSTLSVSGATVFCTGKSVQLEAEFNPDYIYKWKRDGAYINADKNVYSVNQSGNYLSEVSTSKNCMINTNPIAVTVNNSPEIPSINNELAYEICQGESVDLNVITSTGINYQWYLNGGALAQGNSVIFKASQQGKYSVLALATNGCSTGSKDSVSLKVLSMPSSSNIQLSDLPNICPGQPIELSVEDIFGLTYQWQKNGKDITGAVNALYKANSAGNYLVKIANKQCSITTQQQPITEKVGPPVPEMFLKGSVVWYIGCSVKSGVSYIWYKNGIEIPNSNNQIIVPKPAEGTYYVELQNGSECPSRSVDVKIPDDFKTGKFKSLDYLAGFKDIKSSTTIYPNPNKGKFKLYFEDEYNGKILINIKDLSGKTIRQYYADKNENIYLEEMDLSKFGTGVYFIRIDFDNNHSENKIIIQK